MPNQTYFEDFVMFLCVYANVNPQSETDTKLTEKFVKNISVRKNVKVELQQFNVGLTYIAMKYVMLWLSTKPLGFRFDSEIQISFLN